MSLPTGGDDLLEVAQRRSPPPATGLDDAGKTGEGATALRGAGTVGDPAQDHPRSQRAFGFVVSQRQVRVIQDAEDGVPVVEKFDPELAGLFVRGPLQAQAQGAQGIEMALAVAAHRGRLGPRRAGCVDQRLHRPQEHEYATTVEPQPLGQALGQPLGLAQQMRPAAQALGVVAIDQIAVGHEPTAVEGPQQPGEGRLGARADDEDDRVETDQHPQPQVGPGLGMGGFVGMGELGLAVDQRRQDKLRHRIGGAGGLQQRGPDGAHAQLQPQGFPEKLTDQARAQAHAQVQPHQQACQRGVDQAPLGDLDALPGHRVGRRPIRRFAGHMAALAGVSK